MSNHVSILLHSRDAEELMQLLARDDIPADKCELADRLIDRLDAALEVSQSKRRRQYERNCRRAGLTPDHPFHRAVRGASNGL